MSAQVVHVEIAVAVLMVQINTHVYVTLDILGSIVKSVSETYHQNKASLSFRLSVKLIDASDKEESRSKFEIKEA